MTTKPELCCGSLGAALAYRPELLEQRKNGMVVIPVHDGDPENGCRGASGIAITFCPWSGHALRPADRAATGSERAPHACEIMGMATRGEDLIVAYDEARNAYLLPIFDGPPEANCLGRDGIEILFCPWCGIRLREDSAEENDLESLRARLPFGTTNPRF